ERHPVLGLARYVILQRDKYRRADERSPERAHAPEHGHDHEVAGLGPIQRTRVDEVVHVRIKRAGEAREGAGDRPRDPDVLIDGDAEKAGAALVLTDRQQSAAERRAQRRRTPDNRTPSGYAGCRSW